MRKLRNGARKLCVLALVLTGLTSAAAAQSNPPVWGGGGPAAGIYSPAIDPLNPNTVYAAIGFTNYCNHSFRRLLMSA